MKSIIFSLLSITLLLSSCEKESYNPADPTSVVDSQSLPIVDGRLVFSDSAHFLSVSKQILTDDSSIVPDGFMSYEEIYKKVEAMNESEFLSFVETDAYKKYFRTEVDEEGIKSAEPLLYVRSLRKLVGAELDVQIGPNVKRIDGKFLYTVPVDKYDYKNFKSQAISVERVARQDLSRDWSLDDCTKYFLRKNGSWKRKMQGKIVRSTGFISGIEWLCFHTRARKKTVGWWGTTEYNDVRVHGSFQMEFADGSVSNFISVNRECDQCADSEYETIVNSGSTIRQANMSHSLNCGGDCANEGVNGVVSCGTSASNVPI